MRHSMYQVTVCIKKITLTARTVVPSIYLIRRLSLSKTSSAGFHDATRVRVDEVLGRRNSTSVYRQALYAFFRRRASI